MPDTVQTPAPTATGTTDSSRRLAFIACAVSVLCVIGTVGVSLVLLAQANNRAQRADVTVSSVRVTDLATTDAGWKADALNTNGAQLFEPVIGSVEQNLRAQHTGNTPGAPVEPSPPLHSARAAQTLDAYGFSAMRFAPLVGHTGTNPGVRLYTIADTGELALLTVEISPMRVVYVVVPPILTADKAIKVNATDVSGTDAMDIGVVGTTQLNSGITVTFVVAGGPAPAPNN